MNGSEKIQIVGYTPDCKPGVLQLMSDFPETRVISFAMGALGCVSRVLCPLVGGDFIYASIEEGKESASGQVTVTDLRKIYGMLGYGR